MKGLRWLVFFFLCLVVSGSMGMGQTCPQGKTVVIWVNGILVPSQAAWQDQVNQIWSRLLAANPQLNDGCLQKYASYNHSQSVYKDLLQAQYQLSMQEVDKYLNDLESINTAPKAHQSFMAAALGYQQDLFETDPDMRNLDRGDGTCIINSQGFVSGICGVLNWWKAGWRVILVGHSQGTLYTNAEYNIRLRNADGLGKNLPNSNWLSVVNIATPANNVADGRMMYTTHCNDFIYYTPRKDGYSTLSWNVKESSAGCLAHSVADFISNFFSAVGSLLNLGYSNRGHYIDKYFVDGSSTIAQIYSQFLSSVPDPGCVGNVNCYLKDDFSSGVSVDNNWSRVQDTKSFGNKVVQQGGILSVSAGWAPPMPTPVLPDKLSLRTRRVFVGPTTLTFNFRTTGDGVSEIRLKRAVDSSTAVSIKFDFSRRVISVYPDTMSVIVQPSSFSQFTKVTITNSDTDVRLSIGNISTWASSKLMDGYYLELYTESKAGFSTAQIIELQGFLASRTDSSVPPKPVVSPPTGLRVSVAAAASQSTRPSSRQTD